MNDKSKPAGKEAIFDVFRPDGDHNVSSQNYSVAKLSQARERHGPLKKNQWLDKRAALDRQTIEPHALALTGADAASETEDPLTVTASPSGNTDTPTTIRLDTFRIGMEERLAAMQAAQQKARDQLSDLEGQSQATNNLEDPNQGTDKLPES